ARLGALGHGALQEPERGGRRILPMPERVFVTWFDPPRSPVHGIHVSFVRPASEPGPWDQTIIMNSSSRASYRTPASRAFRFTKSFIREIIESRTSGMAAEMAFWLFLSLIPLAAVAGLVIAKIAAESADVAAMLDTLPPETRNMVHRQLGHVAAWNGG